MRRNLHIAFVLVNLWANVQTALSYICMVIQQGPGAEHFLLSIEMTMNRSDEPKSLCVSISALLFSFFFRLIFLFPSAASFEPAQFCLITFVHDANGPGAHACVCLSARPGERCVSGSDSDMLATKLHRSCTNCVRQGADREWLAGSTRAREVAQSYLEKDKKSSKHFKSLK